ncbi:MAG: DUF4340 domain-containing protein [Spirochaetales bacterium]|jgi:hypothetical protein|nr:DUF4340 domain-containing protein [Spirochaetales bacterium]
MRYKTKILGLCLLAAGLSVSLLLGAFYSYRGSESRSVRPFPSFLRTGTIGRLEFYNGEEKITLSAADTAGKAGRSWTVLINGKSFPAAGSKADRFLELLDGASLFPPVTENPENWGLFALEDTAQKRIGISGSSGGTEILLGKEEEAGRGQYIRFAGSNAVYLASQSFSYYVERDSAYWSDLRIFPASLAAADVIAMQAKGGLENPEGTAEVSYSVYRDRRPEGVMWVAEDGGSPDQAKADALAVSVTQISAKAFAPDTDSSAAGLDSPQAVIGFTASNQTRYELRLGRADAAGNRYCAAGINSEPLPYIYLLDPQTAGKISGSP